ncbi:hypothetical protein QQF64_007836 [Cirrhinus molitorella]|uniref:Uncharacterized protein n=1 Tax=Cirrhinus molitorella TaxID=172907 RepID=A0ABR3M7W5_9TELE
MSSSSFSKEPVINTPRSHITEGVCDAECRTALAPGGTVRQRGWQQDFTTRPPAVLGTAAAQCGVRASVGAQMAGEGDTSEMASGRCPLREQAGRYRDGELNPAS